MLEIIKLLLPILDKVIPDPAKRIEAQTELLRIASEKEGKIYEAMKEVMVADASSDSPYTRAARPTIVYWSLGMVSGIVLLAPWGFDSAILTSLAKIPSELWQLMTVGIGAYTIGRSGEKIVRSYKDSR